MHRRDCVNTLQMMEHPERTIDVSWDVASDESFMVQLRILAEGRKEFLNDVTSYLASVNTNIVRVDMRTENALIKAYLILEVTNLSHLTKIMKRLYRIQGVLSVERDSGISQNINKNNS